MLRRKLNILYFVLPALVTAFFAYVACRVYDSPQLHGILSADVLFLMVLLIFLISWLFWRLPLCGPLLIIRLAPMRL